MDRLTFRDEDGDVRFVEICDTKGNPLPISQQHPIWAKRLAAYEDTGLTPEKFAEVKKLCEDYVDAGLDAQFVQVCIDTARLGISTERMWELARAEAEGRLIVLPCKVGDKVYRICPKCNNSHDGSCDNCAWQGTGGVSGCNVFGLWGDGSYDAHHCTIVPWVANYYRMPTIVKKLGTRIFLTREEAEAALKEAHNDT